ncbi:hypothetical protein DRQ36_06995 [bacterium]|nr:MAG: hypothetical protein DRQ36_06995 [bacterium]
MIEKKIAKRSFYIFIACFFICCAGDGLDKQVTVDVSDISVIRVHNNNGSIEVKTAGGTSQTIIGGYINFRLQNGETEIPEIFESYTAADTLIVNGIGSGKGFESIKLSLTVPENLALSLDQNNGNIIVRGVFGEINATLNFGRVTGKIWTEQLDIDVANGSVDMKIPGFKAEGYYLIRVGNGSLKVYLPETAEGADIRAWSENGPLESDFGISATPTVGEFVVGNGPVEMRLLQN